MTIKPVLVPDHDAAALRKLMDTFSEVTTGPTRRELAESRAAVAAAQGVSEGVADTRQLLQAYAGLYYNSRESAGNDMDYDTIQKEMDQIEQQIAKQYGPAGVKKLQKYGYEQYHGRGSFDDDVVREAGVAEATMSRAAKGYEKYGREGMAALAAAGREGKDLDKIRDRYDRYDEAAESGITQEQTAPAFKPGDRVQFTSPRGAVEDGVVVKDLYSGAVEVKFDNGETRGVYATSLKPLPAAVAESIDPIEQLRADILRFSQ